MIDGRPTEPALTYLQKARELLKLDDYEGALTFFLSALEEEPWYLESYLGASYVFYLNEQFAEALSCLRHAEDRLGRNPWLHVERGNVFHKMKLHERALREYERAAALAPEMHEPLLSAADLLFTIEDWKRYGAAVQDLLARFPERGGVALEIERYRAKFG